MRPLSLMFRISAISLIQIFLFASFSFSDEVFTFDTSRSQIKGNVRYVVVGKYQAAFEDFQGSVKFDPNGNRIKEVHLEINVDSIKSKFPRLDGIVRSSRLLDAKKYPSIIFRSHAFEEKGNVHFVSGKLTMHGITKDFSFPFTMSADNKYLQARGRWRINRKDFNIIWHKTFDRGGFLVGNQVIIEWEVFAKR